MFDRCAIRLARGDDWQDIAQSEGRDRRELWQACGKLASMEHEDGERWQAAQNAEVDLHKRDSAIVHAHALRAGLDGVKVKTRTLPNGDVETTEERGSDVALLRLALETGDPSTHGKQAGRNFDAGGGPSVVVQIVAAQVAVIAPSHRGD